MAAEWHYIIGGVQKGPASSSDLKRLAAEGRLTGESLVWRDGLPKWIPARMVKGLIPEQAPDHDIYGLSEEAVAPLPSRSSDPDEPPARKSSRGFVPGEPERRQRGRPRGDDGLSGGIQLLIGLALFPIPALNVVLSSILYYVWRAEKPTRARQINRLGFIVFSLQILSGCLIFGLLMSPAVQSARKAADDARIRDEYARQREAMLQGQPGPGAPALGPGSSTDASVYRSPSGSFTLRIPPGWTRADQHKGPVAEAAWISPEDMLGLVIYEALTVPQELLPDGVMKVMTDAGTNPRRVEDEDRTIPGGTIHMMVIDATPQGVPLTYIYYVHSGPRGTIQATVAAPRERFQTLRPMMELFLSGLELVPPDAGPPRPFDGPPAGL